MVYFCPLMEVLCLANPPEFADATTEHDVVGTAGDSRFPVRRESQERREASWLRLGGYG